MTDLGDALAAERAIVRRGVARVREVDGGWVIRHPPLPDIWHLNRVHLNRRPAAAAGGGGPAAAADALDALAEAALAEVHHRRVTIDDPADADALWPILDLRGWRRERSVVMIRPGGAEPPPRRGPVDAVTELDEPTLAAFQPLAFADDAAVTAISAALPARLAQAQTALRAGSRWRAFGALDPSDADPEVVSAATLFLDPDVGGRRVAFVDQVTTLRPHRERGFARAVLDTALGAAADWGADRVALFADADDWPQIFYASLGFVTVGRQTTFHRDL